MKITSVQLFKTPFPFTIIMTYREQINGKKRKTSIAAYFGFALFVIGLLLQINGKPMGFLALLGFVLFFAGILYLLFFIRCPNCQGFIGYAISDYGSPFSISKKIRFCPFCGVCLDSEKKP